MFFTHLRYNVKMKNSNSNITTYTFALPYYLHYGFQLMQRHHHFKLNLALSVLDPRFLHLVLRNLVLHSHRGREGHGYPSHPWEDA